MNRRAGVIHPFRGTRVLLISKVWTYKKPPALFIGGGYVLDSYKSEIRTSTIRGLLDKVAKRNYENYLVSMRLERIRFFDGARIDFDFPVTALVGPNGGGKSTVLGAAGSAYSSFKIERAFQKSRIGDDSMDKWIIKHEIIDRHLNKTGTLEFDTTFRNNKWHRSLASERAVSFFGLNRTVPAAESTLFTHKKILRVPVGPDVQATFSVEPIADIDHIKNEAERVLGKSLASFQLLRITVSRPKYRRSKIVGFDLDDDGNKLPIYSRVRVIEKTKTSEKLMFLGSDGQTEYSEFNFGAGESSVIHLVADAESLPEGSLLLIEEVENGLHPVALRRLVEYFIDIAQRKRLQVIFTTHSDHALAPLPPEAIWASMDGRLQQGKLSVEVLRAVAGRVDKKLAIFVEDSFAKAWIEAILRERYAHRLDEIGVYAVRGDGNAVKVHLGHMQNPAVLFNSVCFVDGDSQQAENSEQRIFKLPGGSPETTVFNSVLGNIGDNIAVLTIACQRGYDKQEFVAKEIEKVSQTNRDAHLLFSQLGIGLGLVPETTVAGAFLAVWIQENPDEVNRISSIIERAFALPPKSSDSK